jgi:Fe-S-cluster containining protein
MPDTQNKTECDHCGTCCTKGGPALHHEDRPLLLNKWLKREHLVTIRKGEPVLSLSDENPAPAQSEIVKIKGKGIEWTCFLFEDIEKKCSIYDHRPLECSLLKCWDTADLVNTAGKNLLCRYDIIDPHEPIMPLIREHEKKCSLENLAQLLSAIYGQNSQQEAINGLSKMVNTDLEIRSQACAELNLSLDLELFFFGRPFFTLLTQFGIKTHEENGVCFLSADSSPSPATLVNR